MECQSRFQELEATAKLVTLKIKSNFKIKYLENSINNTNYF